MNTNAMIFNKFIVRLSAVALVLAAAAPALAGGPYNPPDPTGQPPFTTITNCPAADQAACLYADELIDILNGDISSDTSIIKGKAGNYPLCYKNYNTAMMYQAQLFEGDYKRLKAKGDKNAAIDAAKLHMNTGIVLRTHLASCLAERQPQQNF